MHIAVVEFGQSVALNARDERLASDIYRPACSLSAERQFRPISDFYPIPHWQAVLDPKRLVPIGVVWRENTVCDFGWDGE